MFVLRNWGRRYGRFAWGLLLGCCCFLGPAAQSSAQQGGLYRIEEDWELGLRAPDGATYSPQISLLMMPQADDLGQYFQLQLNFAADAGFSGGGFQVAAVNEDVHVDSARSLQRSPFLTDGDTVRWTSVMAMIDGELLYAVKNGASIDWGNFGGPEYLVRMQAVGPQSLLGYSAQQSIAQADIGFGANRVSSLQLKSVRFYYLDGSVQEFSGENLP
jgi:hypothetical protein